MKTFPRLEMESQQFTQWYAQRAHQYAERKNLTLFEAAEVLRKIPSSDLRNKEIDRLVDDQYKIINRPDCNTKILRQ